MDFNEFKEICADAGIQMTSFESMMDFSEFKLNSDGLIPVIVQDYKTNEVLMMAYMNEEAFDNTVKTGRMTYYSRSRQCQWVKGETSGHFQYVKSLAIDCDKDTLLAKVDQVGAACHTGNRPASTPQLWVQITTRKIRSRYSNPCTAQSKTGESIPRKGLTQIIFLKKELTRS